MSDRDRQLGGGSTQARDWVKMAVPRMIQLYTFLVSHFSEKARFALDLAQIRYEERPLLPGPHSLTTRRLAPKTTVPVLVHDGRVVQGSSAILDYAETHLGASLTPDDPDEAARVRSLEALADRAFGRGAQTICYASLLDRPDLTRELWSQGRSATTRALYGLIVPLVAARVRSMYRAHPAGAAAAKARFLDALDETDRALEGRRYVSGDVPGRADITLAALLAPIAMPPEHISRWPSEIPDDLAAFVREVEARPTLEHTRRMYREHRRRPS